MGSLAEQQKWLHSARSTPGSQTHLCWAVWAGSGCRSAASCCCTWLSFGQESSKTLAVPKCPSCRGELPVPTALVVAPFRYLALQKWSSPGSCVASQGPPKHPKGLAAVAEVILQPSPGVMRFCRARSRGCSCSAWWLPAVCARAAEPDGRAKGELCNIGQAKS